MYPAYRGIQLQDIGNRQPVSSPKFDPGPDETLAFAVMRGRDHAAVSEGGLPAGSHVDLVAQM